VLQYPAVRKDVNTSCVMALYKNEPARVKRFCTYVVRLAARSTSVKRLDTHFLYLRKVPNYSIRCHLTVHHDQLVVNDRLIHYQCDGECGVDLQSFNRTDIIRLSKTDTGFESLTCKFITNEVVIPFTLPLTGAVQGDMSPSRYFTNLIVLHTYYTELELAGIHGATTWNSVHMSASPVGTPSGHDCGFADETCAAGCSFRPVSGAVNYDPYRGPGQVSQ